MRAAVIGVGHLGKHHARLLAQMPGVTLAGVVDTNRQRGAEIAAAHGTSSFGDWREIGGVDMAVVAVPTESHASIALSLIESGVHTLVEKPLSETVPEADRLIGAAGAKGVVLAVGHSERFNPAVVAARPHIKNPGFIEVHRLGTSPERSLDVDVVLDLMIHDLDLILSLVPGEVDAVEAVGVPVLTPRVDLANARIRFKSGCIANLTASRISREAVRKIRFFQRDAYISVDTAAREVEIYGVKAQAGGVPRIGGGKLDVPATEPLKAELEDFVSAVRDRRAPVVTGEQGRAALVLATRIVELMKGHGN
jgi:predicted dehydrogenase